MTEKLKSNTATSQPAVVQYLSKCIHVVIFHHYKYAGIHASGQGESNCAAFI